MKVIVIDIQSENYGDLGYIISDAIYKSYCHHDKKVYEIVYEESEDPDKRSAQLEVIDGYDPEFLVVVLKPGASIEELPVDLQSNIWQEIKIIGKGE